MNYRQIYARKNARIHYYATILSLNHILKKRWKNECAQEIQGAAAQGQGA